MTREELIRVLRHCGGLGMKICDGEELNHADKCAGCPNEAKMASGSARDCFLAWIGAADMLEKDAQQWISVKDRLPDENGDYLVCARFSTHRVDILRYYANTDGVKQFIHRDDDCRGWYDYDYEYHLFMRTDVVTHWMPLPEIPGE